MRRREKIDGIRSVKPDKVEALGQSQGRKGMSINDASREGPVGLTQEGGKPPCTLHGSVAGFSRFFIMTV